MCQKMVIRIIAASSPQAKGRVERIHGVHQDRLIKKLRRKKIASYEAANEYLETQYLPEHNRRFARLAAKPEDYHGRKPTARELRQIFRLETERTISNDWVIRNEGRYLQLQPGQRRYGPTQSKALDECSLSNYTYDLEDVLMGHALSEEASAPGLQRGRAAHVGTPPQIANRAEEAYGTRGDLAGLGRRSE
jgi:hypothetical protein